VSWPASILLIGLVGRFHGVHECEADMAQSESDICTCRQDNVTGPSLARDLTKAQSDSAWGTLDGVQLPQPPLCLYRLFDLHEAIQDIGGTWGSAYQRSSDLSSVPVCLIPCQIISERCELQDGV
jgi:hypothetical protein